MDNKGELSPEDIAIITDFAYDFDEKKLEKTGFKIVPNSKEDILGTTAIFIFNREKKILVRAGRGTDNIFEDFFRNWIPMGAIDAELLDTEKTRRIIAEYEENKYVLWDNGDSGAGLSANRSQRKYGSKIGITNSTEPIPYLIIPFLLDIDLDNKGPKDGIGVYSAGEILSTKFGYQNLKNNYVVLTPEGGGYYQKVWINENIPKKFDDPLDQRSYEISIREAQKIDIFDLTKLQISIHMDRKAQIENLKIGKYLLAENFNGLESFSQYAPEYLNKNLYPSQIFGGNGSSESRVRISLDLGNGNITTQDEVIQQYNTTRAMMDLASKAPEKLENLINTGEKVKETGKNILNYVTDNGEFIGYFNPTKNQFYKLDMNSGLFEGISNISEYVIGESISKTDADALINPVKEVSYVAPSNLSMGQRMQVEYEKHTGNIDVAIETGAIVPGEKEESGRMELEDSTIIFYKDGSYTTILYNSSNEPDYSE